MGAYLRSRTMPGTSYVRGEVIYWYIRLYTAYSEVLLYVYTIAESRRRKSCVRA